MGRSVDDLIAGLPKARRQQVEAKSRQIARDMIKLPDDNLQAIRTLAESMHELQRQAAQQYLPVVEDILRNRSRDTRHIEHTFDGLLDFCGHEPVLQLYKKLCRQYWDIDPAATADYINLYREHWDSDDPGGHRTSHPTSHPTTQAGQAVGECVSAAQFHWNGYRSLRRQYHQYTGLVMDILRHGADVEVVAPAALRTACAGRWRGPWGRIGWGCELENAGKLDGVGVWRVSVGAGLRGIHGWEAHVQ